MDSDSSTFWKLICRYAMASGSIWTVREMIYTHRQKGRERVRSRDGRTNIRCIPLIGFSRWRRSNPMFAEREMTIAVGTWGRASVDTEHPWAAISPRCASPRIQRSQPSSSSSSSQQRIIYVLSRLLTGQRRAISADCCRISRQLKIATTALARLPLRAAPNRARPTRPKRHGTNERNCASFGDYSNNLYTRLFDVRCWADVGCVRNFEVTMTLQLFSEKNIHLYSLHSLFCNSF